MSRAQLIRAERSRQELSRAEPRRAKLSLETQICDQRRSGSLCRKTLPFTMKLTTLLERTSGGAEPSQDVAWRAKPSQAEPSHSEPTEPSRRERSPAKVLQEKLCTSKGLDQRRLQHRGHTCSSYWTCSVQGLAAKGEDQIMITVPGHENARTLQ